MNTLLDRLFAVAGQAPGSIAIVDKEESITYSDLANKVRILGRNLATECPAGSTVVIVVPNSISYVIALYGCWFAGLIAVPTDANAKEREIEQVVKHARPQWLISTSGKKQVMSIVRERGLNFVDIGKITQGESSSKTSERRSVDDALIIYTSGTSGDPKGVVLTHDNLWANVVSVVEYLALSSEDSSVVVLPFHYSYGNSVLHTHLFVGAKVVIGASMMYPQQVTDQLRHYHVTGFSGVPTTMSLLVHRTDFASDPPPLRYITQAGGGMDRNLTVRLRQALAEGTSLFVMYGQTEATARLTWLPPDRLDEKLGSAGKSIPGVTLRIAGSNGQQVPARQVGEVLAFGDNVMSRYWCNPEATAATVVDGWLHTGDLGFLDEDGFLFIQGRASEMIKSGAHRVSPKEIEEVISSLECVDEVAVCGLPDEILGQAIAAFLVGDESAINARKVLSYCRRSLSLHKVPRYIEWREQLPRTASGKLKKHLLVASHDTRA